MALSHRPPTIRGYGGLLIHEASAGQVIATGAAQKFTLWETASPEAGGVDGQVANDRIVIVTPGTYLLAWHMSFETSDAAAWRGHIYRAGASAGIDWDRNVLAASRPGSVSCIAAVAVSANDAIEAYISHDQGGNVTVTPISGQLCVVRVGL